MYEIRNLLFVLWSKSKRDLQKTCVKVVEKKYKKYKKKKNSSVVFAKITFAISEIKQKKKKLCGNEISITLFDLMYSEIKKKIKKKNL